MRAGDWDESRVRVRANPRGSRPRTKRRPDHADAVEGRVVAVDRGRYAVHTPATALTAMRARELGRRAVVVGDRVRLVGDVSGAPGTLARIVGVQERTTVLRRSADDVDPVERAVVANADRLVVVTSLADPPPRPRLIDRCLVAAWDGGLAAALCLTKTDLGDQDDTVVQDLYRPLGVPILTTGLEPDGSVTGLEEVRDLLAGTWSVLLGHSGVGKSTLVNALVPQADRAVGAVNDVTGRGRHTSSSAVALALPEGGWVVDTPGVRSFGLAHVDPARLPQAFTDLAAVAADCPRGCTHDADAPDCALDEWVQGDGAEAGPRVESFRRLLASLQGEETGTANAGEHRQTR